MSTIGAIQKCKLYGDKSCTTIIIGISNIDKHFIISHTIKQPVGE